MRLKTAILSTLGRDDLKRIVEGMEIPDVDRRSVDRMRSALSTSRRATPAALLGYLGKDALTSVCQFMGAPVTGPRKELIDRLLAAGGAEDGKPKRRRPAESDGLAGPDVAPASPTTRRRRARTAEDPAPESSAGGQSGATTGQDTRLPASSGGRRTHRAMAKKQDGGKRPIEQYEHADKTRPNNPPVGLVTPATDPEQPKKTYQYDPHLDPQLVWAGKAEHTSFEVPTASLHVHERIDPRSIIRAVQKRNGSGSAGGLHQLSLFEEPEENPPLREAIEFYKHAHGCPPDQSRWAFDTEHPIRTTSDMRAWYTGRPCEWAKRSHVNFCVYDSTWEASEAFALDHDPRVDAWVKNDHLGFEVLYVYKGVVRKYRPDFLIRLTNGKMLVLEVKGQDNQQNETKRRFSGDWCRAVNEQGGFGKWEWDVSRHPGDVKDTLLRH